ncbi:hypothetical protein CHITON_0501 [Thermococcus chitonophagus]|uniref:Uncharacterized protein n=1 Tax=Thermococcus chitonophagus TaxID=54262 RepID=A0A160VRA0_9EURY|nr:hypothetical protein CHITON_0501 [Thermococcus chitonophagus]
MCIIFVTSYSILGKNVYLKIALKIFIFINYFLKKGEEERKDGKIH